PLFYRAGKPTGEKLTTLRGEYRQQVTSWLQGQAELTIFGASERYRAQMENTELSWHDAQRRQSELTALSQAVMLLINAVAVLAMLWLAAGGVGGDTQPGALIALFVFCALAAFEALAPVTGAFQHLGQVIASAVRITQITQHPPEVRFSENQTPPPAQVALTLTNVSFSYAQQPQKALDDLSLQINAGEHVAILGRTGCGKSTLLQLLTRAWDPAAGEIALNGQPLASLSESAL
ncbi:ATP-binding cassette domain-containing protein, partial [Pseudescherichia sp.]